MGGISKRGRAGAAAVYRAVGIVLPTQLFYGTAVFARCILRAAFALEQGDRTAIAQEMERIITQRREKQPLEYPSAGSTFKRPQGAYASQLIDQCGLRGLTVGGAQVSKKHAGFVVNIGGATCADVLGLVEQVKDCVKEKTGFVLEMEVRQLP